MHRSPDITLLSVCLAILDFFSILRVRILTLSLVKLNLSLHFLGKLSTKTGLNNLSSITVLNQGNFPALSKMVEI